MVEEIKIQQFHFALARCWLCLFFSCIILRIHPRLGDGGIIMKSNLGKKMKNEMMRKMLLRKHGTNFPFFPYWIFLSIILMEFLIFLTFVLRKMSSRNYVGVVRMNMLGEFFFRNFIYLGGKIFLQSFQSIEIFK